MDSPRLKRRYLQYSLRGLLALMLVCAVWGYADRQEASVKEISWSDIKRAKGDSPTAFETSYLSESAKTLDKTRVRLRGYMLPMGKSPVRRFLLVRSHLMKFAWPRNDEEVLVKLREGTTIDYANSEINVEGTLLIKPLKSYGVVVCIYQIEDAVKAVPNSD